MALEVQSTRKAASPKDFINRNKQTIEMSIKGGRYFWLNNLNQSDSFLLFTL
jgi:hypothetical protein